MKKIFALACLSLSVISRSADNERTHVTTSTDAQSTTITIPHSLGNIGTIGLCFMSFGAGLCLKRHPILGSVFIGVGVISRKAPDSEGYQHVKNGFTEIKHAQTFQEIQSGSRSMLRGMVLFSKDALHAFEQQLSKKE